MKPRRLLALVWILGCGGADRPAERPAPSREDGRPHHTVPPTPTAAGPLRLATFNAGLAVDVVPHAREREPHVLAALAALPADVVCVQEIWQETTWRSLVEAARLRFPFTIRSRVSVGAGAACSREEVAPALECALRHCSDRGPKERSRCVLTSCAALGLRMSHECLACLTENRHAELGDIASACVGDGGAASPHAPSTGMALLSRAPLRAVEELALESSLHPRSVIHAAIEGLELGPLHVFCAHLTPVLRTIRTRSAWRREQSKQIDALLAFVDRVAGDAPAVLLGDLNCGPAIEPAVRGRLVGHYARFSAAGFANPFASSSVAACTFCDENPIVGGSRWPGAAGVLIDHALTRNVDASVSASRTLDRPVSVVVGDRRLELRYSDHYGVVVSLDASR